MEELTLTTPSILFSAISLIMLAYTNRFLSHAQVIRNLKAEHESHPSPITRMQLENLRRRLYMSRAMQIFGVASLLLCVVCTFLIYVGLQKTAVYAFGIALLLLVFSLGISIREILISVRALEYHLNSMKTGIRTSSADTPSINKPLSSEPVSRSSGGSSRAPRQRSRNRNTSSGSPSAKPERSEKPAPTPSAAKPKKTRSGSGQPKQEA